MSLGPEKSDWKWGPKPQRYSPSRRRKTAATLVCRRKLAITAGMDAILLSQISQIYGVQIYVPYLAANLGWKSLGPETRAIHPAFLLRGYRMHVKIWVWNWLWHSKEYIYSLHYITLMSIEVVDAHRGFETNISILALFVRVLLRNVARVCGWKGRTNRPHQKQENHTNRTPSISVFHRFSNVFLFLNQRFPP